jgi:chemotaxis signal transduction protein
MNRPHKEIAWATIRAELERRSSQVATTYERDPSRAEALLRERSLRLARPPTERGGANLARAVVFRRGSERYGLPLDGVQEISPLPRVTAFPGRRRPALGIVGWRGDLVVAFDPARLLGAAAAEDMPWRYLIVLRGGDIRTGLAATAVDGLMHLDHSTLQSPEQVGANAHDLLLGLMPEGTSVLRPARLQVRLSEELRAA